MVEFGLFLFLFFKIVGGFEKERKKRWNGVDL